MSPKIQKMRVNILLYDERICKEIHYELILINCSVVSLPRWSSPNSYKDESFRGSGDPMFQSYI